jgi:hypothetical protein
VRVKTVISFYNDDDSPKEGNMEDAVTISIPEAGKRFYGLSRDGSYAAARRGEIVTIKVGRLFRVPVAAQMQHMAEITKKGRDS